MGSIDGNGGFAKSKRVGGGTWSGSRFKNWIRNGWIVPHRASLINFREEATTCCLIIASHGEPPRHRATLFFLYPPILVCTPRKSMPSPPLHWPRYPRLKCLVPLSFISPFWPVDSRLENLPTGSPPFSVKPIPIDRNRPPFNSKIRHFRFLPLYPKPVSLVTAFCPMNRRIWFNQGTVPKKWKFLGISDTIDDRDRQTEWYVSVCVRERERDWVSRFPHEKFRREKLCYIHR